MIAFHATTGDNAFGAGRDIGVVAEAFALVDVGNVDFDDRAIEGVESIENCNGRMGIGAGIDDDGCGFLAGLMDPVDQLMFGIALLEADLELQFRRQSAAVRFNIGQGGVAIDLGLALTQQVQIGAVEDEDRF